LEEWADALAAMGAEERWVALAFVAGQGVVLDDDELAGALRRAVLLRATGGDPHRDLELDETSVRRLAEELDEPERREQLQVELASLRELGDVRPEVADAIFELLSNPELAWRCFAAARIAAELADED
jgi:hypothetical protein